MAIKPSHILGMNARHKYTKKNPYSAKRYGFSKLRTKELLREHKIPTAAVFHTFDSLGDLENINWETIPVPFVIKPASGSAGKGILVITDKNPKKLEWKNSDGEKLTDEDLSLHIGNILEGEFSTWGSTHKAIIEEMIPSHPELLKYSFKGTPDIRIIIFNNVPVMAMARIPTKASSGKANLDQGAIGLGIDMATGITTYGVNGKSGIITHFPGTKKKVAGIPIPQWNKLLETAVMASEAAGYVFMGADLFIHPTKGPMIVELNGFPGLSIQLCNKAGLKRRLERVSGLEVRDAKHGVKISQALFAHNFSDAINVEEGIKVIPTKPKITVFDDRNKGHETEALVNTGRYRSAISENYAHQLGILDIDDLLWRQQESIEGKVPVVEIKFKLKGKRHKTAMVVIKKLNKSKYKIELGRIDLQGFLVGDVKEE
jgi:alpha-L-glutamate ligase-like protein